jgi:rubrerythrin
MEDLPSQKKNEEKEKVCWHHYEKVQEIFEKRERDDFGTTQLCTEIWVCRKCGHTKEEKRLDRW